MQGPARDLFLHMNIIPLKSPSPGEDEAAANSFERLFTRATARTDVPNLARHTPSAEAFDVLAEDLVSPPESWRDDKFAAQLEDLAAKLDNEVPDVVEGEQFGVLDGGGPMTARVASRFSTWTRQARNT